MFVNLNFAKSAKRSKIFQTQIFDAKDKNILFLQYLIFRMSGSDASDSEDEMYDVEKIVDERYKDEEGNDVEVQYRVRWKGFPPGTISRNFLL